MTTTETTTRTINFPPKVYGLLFTQYNEVNNFIEAAFISSRFNPEQKDNWLKALNNGDGLYNNTIPDINKGLVRRRFGIKMGGLPGKVFYDTTRSLVLPISSEINKIPSSEKELILLFGLISKDPLDDVGVETDLIKKNFIEVYIKPLMLKYLDGRWVRAALAKAGDKASSGSDETRKQNEKEARTAGISNVISLMKDWINSPDSTERILNKILSIQKELWIDYPKTYDSKSTKLEESSAVSLEDFFESLFGPNPIMENKGLNPVSLLGFDEEIKQVFDENNPTGALVEGMLSSDKEVQDKLKKIADRFGTNQSPLRELKDETDILNMRQCALMQIAKERGIKDTTNPNLSFPLWLNEENYFHDAEGKPKIMYELYNSTNLLNTLLNKRPSGDLWYSQKHRFEHSVMNKKLFWIFSDESGDLRQSELFLTQDRLVEDYWDNIFEQPNIINNKENFGAFQSSENLRKGHYYLRNCTISYEGTNPSTANKDVKVEMEFQISSLASLELPISNKIIINKDTKEGYFIKLYNLITLPVTSKISPGSGMGSLNPHSYKPDYSRVRLVVYDSPEDTSAISIDLSTIDHSISRDSSTGACTLKINYRGYFEQTLQMPEMDVLSNSEKREKKRQIDKEMNRLQNSDQCSVSAIREAKRLELRFYQENTAKIKSSRFITELHKKGKIYDYELDAPMLIKNWNNSEEFSLESIRRFTLASNLSSIDDETILEDENFKNYVNSKGSRGETDGILGFFKKQIGDIVYKGSCFFLGDLFDLAIDTIYEDETVRKKLKLQFIFGNINIDSPMFGGDVGSTGINPLFFPVDVVLFMKWFEQRVVAKKISFYPITTFFKDLLQTLLVDLATKFCVADNPEPPMYRMAFINTTTMDDFLNSTSGINMNNPFGGGEIHPILKRSPLQSNEDSFDQTRNYCVFYQQTESRFSGIQYNLIPTTPKIFYGMKNNKWNIVSNVSFSKTDAPYLREARYFNNNFGDLSLLSNVYNLSFSFNKRMANKDFYPGVIFEFILLDWGPEWNDEEPIIATINSGVDYSIFGESNPHKSGTISNITGFGGYYIVTKVDYVLGETNKDFEIKIESKFIGANESVLMRRGKMENNLSKEEQKALDDRCLEQIKKATAIIPEEEKKKESGFFDSLSNTLLSYVVPGTPNIASGEITNE